MAQQGARWCKECNCYHTVSASTTGCIRLLLQHQHFVACQAAQLARMQQEYDLQTPGNLGHIKDFLGLSCCTLASRASITLFTLPVRAHNLLVQQMVQYLHGVMDTSDKLDLHCCIWFS